MRGFAAVMVVGPDGTELKVTRVAGADFRSVDAVGVDARGRRFGVAVTCFDDDAEARKFVGVDGEIEREMLLWLVDYCGGLLG